MRHGFIKTAAGTPKIQVADCVYNAGEILKLIRQMETEGAKIMAFPELQITFIFKENQCGSYRISF